MKTYVFMYILADDVDRIRKSLGSHVSYWKGLKLDYYKNGPFADKSGGLIVFETGRREKAEDILREDPLITEKAVSQYWLKEWVA